MASTAITIRVPEATHERLIKAVGRARCTKTEWVLEALLWALEKDEEKPVPKAIAAAMPRRVGNKMMMPDGVVHNRQF